MSDKILISVIIPTFNPDYGRLLSTLEGLRRQTMSFENWEIVIVDNNSTNDIPHTVDLSWHRQARTINERRSGLTYARLKGFAEAKGKFIILVDDDNVLNETYLCESLKIMTTYSSIGAIGGISSPIFEAQPPEWLNEFYASLALRNLGNSHLIERWQNRYPESAPIGAGMVIRKTALKSYVSKINAGDSVVTDRIGSSLTSGGDNDIVIEILRSGWEIGYFPELLLDHLIPKERTTVKYLARLVNQSSKSWMKLLDSHSINPWNKIKPWTVPLRKAKAWVVYKAWQNKVNYIRWRGACGIYDGLANYD